MVQKSRYRLLNKYLQINIQLSIFTFAYKSTFLLNVSFMECISLTNAAKSLLCHTVLRQDSQMVSIACGHTTDNLALTFLI